MLAAALVLALVAGFWRINGGIIDLGSGGDSDNGNAQFAAQTGEATAESETPTGIPENVPPRPTAVLSDEPLITMPTAVDCTVEPLSVEDVLTIVENPDAANRTPIYATEDRIATPAAQLGTEGPGYLGVDRPTTQDERDAVAAARFEYIACAMTGDWFRVWALSDPSLVYRDVVDELYPIYITREDARLLLEELRDAGRAGGLPYLPERFGNFANVELVHPDPNASRVDLAGDDMIPVAIVVGTMLYTAEGRAVVDGERLVVAPMLERDPEDRYYQFAWSNDRNRWLVVDDKRADIY